VRRAVADTRADDGYAVLQRAVYLLAVKHHKQLSVDLPRLWQLGG
jgi:hypothetical protein